MSKVKESVATYQRSLMADAGQEEVDLYLLEKIILSLGASFLDPDFSIISLNDEVEIKNIKSTFLIRELGLEDGAFLEKRIKKLVQNLKKHSSTIPRAAFYYLLVNEFKLKPAFNARYREIYTLNELDDFGVEFLGKQKDIEPEIRKAADAGFDKILL